MLAYGSSESNGLVMAMYGCCKSPTASSHSWAAFTSPTQALLLFNSPSSRSLSPSFKDISRGKAVGISHCGCRWKRCNNTRCLAYRWDEEKVGTGSEGESFEIAVFLFNAREYYRCHDVLENLWNQAEEPQRTLLHGILQCSVGFYHLFNQNHQGAMIELGEGLSKLRKMDFRTGPFYQFEQDVSSVLDFIYSTQLERAACTDEYCLTMDGSERSYQLLGNFGAGKPLYELQKGSNDELYIVFSSKGLSEAEDPVRVRVPVLQATQVHLMDCAKY